MRRLVTIAAATLVVAACSRPTDGDDPVVIDLGRDMQQAADAMALPTIEGELVAEPNYDGINEVRIVDAETFLFVIQDGDRFAWLDKQQGFLLDFAFWPDPTRPDDGPPSTDVAHGDTYLWFLSEHETGWNLAGVEHFLGAPEPLFGQPIIIIDLGPIQKPRGIERYGERFVIPLDPEVVGEPGEIIVVGENIPPMRKPGFGAPITDSFDGWLATDVAGTYHLAEFDPAVDEFESRWTFDDRPRAFAVDGDTPYVVRADGGVWNESGDARVGRTAETNPVIDAHASVVAWTVTDGIHVFDGALRRIAVDDVDAVIVDDTHVWWSNAGGVFRAPLD